MRLSDKYEPKTIADMIASKQTKRRLQACLDNPVSTLLYGPPGTGKNTFLNILESSSPKYTDGKPVWNFYIKTGVDITADKLKSDQYGGSDIPNFCHYGHLTNGYRQYVVINEFEKVREDNQTILRDIVERFQNKTPFIIMLNDIEIVDKPLLDRFIPIELGTGIDQKAIRNYCIDIIKKEDATVPSKSLNKIIHEHMPSMRKILHELELEIFLNNKGDIC